MDSPSTKILFFFSFIFLYCLFFLLFPLKVHAAIILSEIYPAPATGESEWVEVFNTGPETVTVGGWTLKDQLSTPTVIFTFSDQSISPGSYFVAELPSAKLNNTSDGVTLFDGSGQTIDTMSYSSTESTKSWQRTASNNNQYVLTAPTKGNAHSDYSFQFSQNTPMPTATPTLSSQPTPSANPEPSVTPSPTPSSNPTPTASPASTSSPSPTATATPSSSQSLTSSSSPSPTASSTQTASPTPSPTTTAQPDYSKIQLSEMMACPSSSSEWIELHNTDTKPLEIKSWKVIDESGNIKTISGTTPAQGWQVFYWTGSLLNNAGDSLTLTTNIGQTISQADYQNCTVGFSLVFSEKNGTKNWLAAIATPGEKNASPVVDDSDTDTTTATSSATSSKSAQAVLTSAKKTAATIADSLKNSVQTTGQVLGTFFKPAITRLNTADNLTLPPLSLTSTATPSAHRSTVFTTRDSNVPGKSLFGTIFGGVITIGSSIKLLYDRKITS